MISRLRRFHGGHVLAVALPYQATASYTTNQTKLDSSTTCYSNFCLVVPMLKVQSMPLQYIAFRAPSLFVTELFVSSSFFLLIQKVVSFCPFPQEQK